MSNDKDSEKQHLIITGSVTSGFVFTGPFPNLMDAVEWGRDNTHRIGMDWTCAPLAEPSSAAAPGAASAPVRLSA